MLTLTILHNIIDEALETHCNGLECFHEIDTVGIADNFRIALLDDVYTADELRKIADAVEEIKDRIQKAEL